MTASKINKKIVLPSEKTSITKIEPVLSEIKKEHNIPDENFYNIMIAVTEAVNNAIIHGNKQNPNKKVNFSIEANEQLINITIEDQGEGFNPNELEDCLKPENLLKDGGRGVFIIKELMDSVQIQNTGNGTKLKMTYKHKK